MSARSSASRDRHGVHSSHRHHSSRSRHGERRGDGSRARDGSGPSAASNDETGPHRHHHHRHRHSNSAHGHAKRRPATDEGGATPSSSPSRANAKAASGSGGTSASAKKGTIVIHVCDENRKINRDFVCRRDLLLTEMRYFRNYLGGNNACDDVDISVHCDVHIFEWLMKYIHNRDNPPKLEVRSVVSILISSNFLEMKRLVEECLRFLHARFNSIVKLPIDLGCLNQSLLTRLARLFSDAEMDGLRDRKDKLLSKVYMHRTQFLLEDRANRLYCCQSCHCLFTASQRATMICSKAKLFVDFHGNAIARHVPNKSWSVRKFLRSLREQKLSWRRIYWKIWGITHSMTCRGCGMQFIAAALGHCHYHPAMPQFSPGENVGRYPCCDAVVYRFDTAAWQTGCTVRDHKVDPVGPDAATLQQLLKHRDVVTVPYRRVLDAQFMEARLRSAGAVGDAKEDRVPDGAGGGRDLAPASGGQSSSKGPLAHLTNRPHSPRGEGGSWPTAQAVASTSMTSWAAAASGRADAEASSGAMKVPPGFLVEGDVVEEDDVDADDDFAKQYGAFNNAMPIEPLSGTPGSVAVVPARVDPRRARMWMVEEQRYADESRMASLMHRLEALRGDKKAGTGPNTVRTMLAM